MIKDLGMRRLSRWALHGITSVLMREGDPTQTEDRRYDREGALSDTAKYERRSAATRNYKRQEQMASQRTLRKRFPSPVRTLRISAQWTDFRLWPPKLRENTFLF